MGFDLGNNFLTRHEIDVVCPRMAQKYQDLRDMTTLTFMVLVKMLMAALRLASSMSSLLLSLTEKESLRAG